MPGIQFTRQTTYQKIYQSIIFLRNSTASQYIRGNNWRREKNNIWGKYSKCQVLSIEYIFGLCGGAAGALRTFHLDNTMKSFPAFDMNVDIMRSIMSVPVGPRRMVALLYRFGHRLSDV